MKTLFAVMAAVLLCGASAPQSTESFGSWRTFHSVSGKCTIAFPEQPEHVHQRLPMSEEGYDLNYDVYIAPHKQEAVYMVLIAQYPPFVSPEHSDKGLESFLNGILSQNPNNRLIFADLTEVNGYKALDFFIQTKGVYFKGRAVMAKSSLYLIAMECESQNYQESHFTYFINSFELHG